MKEEKGLFLDGSSARSILSKMFQANHNEENIMNHMEHRKLIKWVCSSGLSSFDSPYFCRLIRY